MYTTFSATGPSRSQVAAGLIGAHAGDPVVAHDASKARPSRGRSLLASALHRAGDALAPARH